MRLPRPGHDLRLVLLLLASLTLDICHGRPQHQPSTAENKAEGTSQPAGQHITAKDEFFEPGAWRPVASDTGPTIEQKFHIDQERSRIRLEKGDDGKQRGGKNENTADNRQLTTLPIDNTSVNNTGRAKQSSGLGDSLKNLANQLLDSQYYDRDSDESERGSEEEETSDESMVEEDVRTPPKLKSQLKQKHSNQQPKTSTKATTTTVEPTRSEEEANNKGVAVPVIIDDDDDVDKTIEKLSYEQGVSIQQSLSVTTPKKKPVTTPTTHKPYYESTSSDGVSTWVLLSGSSSTTPSQLANKRKNNKSPTPIYKTSHVTPSIEIIHTSTSSSEETKIPYSQFGGDSSFESTRNPTIFVSKPSTLSMSSSGQTVKNPGYQGNKSVTEPETLFKPYRTRKPNPMRTTTVRTKIISSTSATTSTEVSENTATRRNPLRSTQKVSNKLTTVKPIIGTTNKLLETTSLKPSTTLSFSEEKPVITGENNLGDSSTEDAEESTTKQTRRPTEGTKKRKKNKNRRRRPTKKPGISEELESKTDDNNATSSSNKVVIKERPLTTRIYNYLAREVMPSVGVGLIGLVVTAGLAGLFMYPFGGGLAARRTYEENGPPHYMPHSPYYRHGEYEGEMDSGMSEEEVFGKLLEGMNDKGEFTYSGIGEESTGYTGDMSPGKDNRYKTMSGRLEDSQSYGTNGYHGIRYGGGRIVDANRFDNKVRYDNRGSENYPNAGTDESKGTNVYGNMDNAPDKYKYSGISTKSGEVADSIGDSQPLYSGNANTQTKQYSVGSVHVDNTPHHHSGSGGSSEVSASYGSPYYKSPHYTASQSYGAELYPGLTAIGVQTYGNVQVDDSGPYHSGGTMDLEKSEGIQKSTSSKENKSQGTQQYRRGISDTKQQYRDIIGTQPRSGGTIIAVSVTKEPRTQKVKGTPEEENSNIDEIKSEKLVANDKIDDKESDNTGEKNLGPSNKGFMDTNLNARVDISSRLSPELQKRGSLIAGLVEHGPRSLRRRREANSVLPEEDEKDNEIDSVSVKLQNDSNDKVTSIPVYSGENKGMTGNKMDQGVKNDSNLMKAEIASTTATSTIFEEVTTISGVKNIDISTTFPTESTTLMEEISTTDINNDGEEEDDSGSEEDDDYESTISPEVTTTVTSDSTKKSENLQESTTNKPDTPFSLLTLFRRIARYKLRMGLNLIKSTSQALTNYIERVQKRFDKAQNNNINKSTDIRRFKRALNSKTFNSKKLQEQLSYMNKKQHTPMIKTILKAVGY